MRVAAIDVGTNTALLLIADVTAGGALNILQEEERFVRLGEGVDASRQIRPAAIERLRVALEAYAGVIREAGVEQTVVVGTSASRDASNAPELNAIVEQCLGVPFDVISGEEEARRTFEGAVALLPHIEGTCAVVDVGGGSTEVVVGSAHNGRAEIRRRLSVNLGGVRLTERFFRSAPPPASAVEDARAHVEETLDAAGLNRSPGITVIGTSGTARSLAFLSARVRSWEETDGRGLDLSHDAVAGWRRRLLGMTTQDVLALDPYLLSGRADILPAGVLILECVLDRLGPERFVVSRGGLREGVALAAARNNRP